MSLTDALSAEARELSLHTDNTQSLYRMTHAIHLMLARKVVRGVYDPEKAPRAFIGLADVAARTYCAEYCEGAHQARYVFPSTTRYEFATMYARYFESCVRQRTLDDLGEAAARLLAATLCKAI